MHEEQATAARDAFTRQHQVGKDDKEAPKFYKMVARHFSFIKKKIVFIVVPHMVHTLPYFLEAITEIGVVVAIIPKASQYVRDVKRSLGHIYEPFIRSDIDKMVLNTDPAKSRLFLREISDKYPDCQLMILDHGGYFAPRLDVLREFSGRLAGIVEHTWNGDLRYQAELQNSPLQVPVFSIARSPLKAYEDDHVATSIINAMSAVIFGGSGLSQDLSRLKIGIIGYGHMGEAIANRLRKIVPSEHIMICDNDEEKRGSARRFFSSSLVVAEQAPLLEQCDVIIAAASVQTLGRDEFSKMKAGACVICVTSSDDQFKPDAKEGLTKIGEATYVTTYRRPNGDNIYLACNGTSVNFLIGSTAHPVLHAVLASVLVSAHQCSTTRLAAPSSSIMVLSPQQLFDIEVMYEGTFGRIEHGVEMFGLKSSPCYFVGRVAERRRLQAVLTTHQDGVIVQAISGLPGLGKSTLASRYAKDALQRKEYDLVALFDATTAKTLYDDFILFALHLGIDNPRQRSPREVVQAIYKHLAATRRLLIIFDNSDQYRTLTNALVQGENVDFLPPPYPGQLAHCIATTRNQRFQGDKRNVVELLGLSEEDSCAYITHYLADITKEDAIELANISGCFPLALCQMVAYLSVHSEVSAKTYIANYRSSPEIQEGLLRTEVLPGDRYTSTVYKAFIISLQDLVKKDPLSIRVLNIFAYFHSTPIPLAVLRKLEEELGRVDLIRKAIEHLQTYSLVEFNEKDQSLRFHDLVQIVSRLVQQQSGDFTNLRHAFALAYDYCRLLPDRSPFVAHSLSVTTFHDKHLPAEATREKIELLLILGTELHWTLLFSREAVAAYEFAKRIRNRAPLAAAPDLDLAVRLANAHAATNPLKYVAVLDEMLQSDQLTVDLILRNFAIDDMAMAKEQIINSIGGFLSCFRSQEPRQFFETLLKFKQIWLPHVHIILYSLGSRDLAIAYLIFKKKLSEAEYLARQFLRESEHLNPYDKTAALCLLAEAVALQGQLTLADGLKYTEQARTMLRQMTGSSRFFYDQIYLLSSVFHAVGGDFAESNKIIFEALDTIIAEHGEEGVKRRIESLLTIIDLFEEILKDRTGSVEDHDLMRGNQLLAQAFRIGARLLGALDVRDRARELFQRSLIHDPNCTVTRYEYGLQLARDAKTRPQGVLLLERVAQGRNLQPYSYYQREAQHTLPKIMVPLATTEPRIVSLYFLSCWLLAWAACRDGRYHDCKTMISELLEPELTARPDLSAPLLFTRLRAKVARKEDNSRKLAKALMISGEFKFEDGTIITLEPDGKICIKTTTETYVSGTEKRHIFANEFGEGVIELSGVASKYAREDRSWAFAYFQKDGGHSSLHYHSKRAEIYYVVNGVATVMIDGKENILRRGQEITINPGQQHQVFNKDPDHTLAMLVKCTPSWTLTDQKFVDVGGIRDADVPGADHRIRRH